MTSIKIVTFHRTNSYGALLQAYSLHHFLSNLGHDVQFIDYSTRNKTQYEPFMEFTDEYLPKTVRIDTFDELEQIKADILICGSDQIWNLDITLSENPESNWDFYFLNFGGSDIKRVSYAASSGGIDIPEKFRDKAKHALSRLDHISVREKQTRDIVSNLTNKDIDLVLDPVFLTEKFPIKKPEIELPEKYIALISMQRNAELYEIVKTVKKQYNLPVVVSDYSQSKCPIADVHLPVIRPDEWLYYIKNSEFICTNSFHALSFALKFQKQFLAIPLFKPSYRQGLYRRIVEYIYRFELDNLLSFFVKRPLKRGVKRNKLNKKMCRIEEVLTFAGLESRIAMDQLSLDRSFEKIDYNKVEEKLLDAKVNSRAYLENIIKVL